MKKALLLLVMAGITGCYPREANVQNMMGMWRGEEGLSLDLRPDGTYRFCDRNACFDEKYERIGGGASIAIYLKNFFLHPQSGKIKRVLHYLKNSDEYYRKNPDLSFNVSSDYWRRKECNNEICVSYGSLEDDDDNIIIVKADD